MATICSSPEKLSDGQSEDATSPPWVILASVAKVCTEADLPPGGDFSLALEAPPRITVLKVSRGIFPTETAFHHFPKVVAAHASGLVLLHADQGPADGPVYVNLPGRIEPKSCAFLPGYFVLDATTGSTFSVPSPQNIDDCEHLALLPTKNPDFVLAELQHGIGRTKVRVLIFNSEHGNWTEETFDNPMMERRLAPHGAFAHGERVWWVDLSAGLFTIDPVAQNPVLRVVPLPPGTKLEEKIQSWASLQKYRCVGVSDGKIRFASIFGAPSEVEVWTLADPDDNVWTLDHRINFSNLQGTEGYRAARLPQGIPHLAVVHPDDPSFLYFHIANQIFCVNLRTLEVLGGESTDRAPSPSDYLVGRHFRPWKIPNEVSPGIIAAKSVDVHHANLNLKDLGTGTPTADAPSGGANQFKEYLKDPSKFAAAAPAAAVPSGGDAASAEEKEESAGESETDGLA